MQVEMRPALQFLQEASLDVSKWEVESRAALGLEHAQKLCLVEAWDHMNTHTSLHHIYVYYTYDIPTVYIRIYIYTWHQLSTVKRIYIYTYTHCQMHYIYILWVTDTHTYIYVARLDFNCNIKPLETTILGGPCCILEPFPIYPESTVNFTWMALL